MITMLKTIVAGIKRDRLRTVRSNHRGDRIQRASHAGVPISSSGAAMMAYVVCCTMCTQKKYRSPRSWIGQSDATHNARRPAEKVEIWKRVTMAEPVGASRGPNRFSASEYPAAIAPMSSHTSGCGAQAGKATAASTITYDLRTVHAKKRYKMQYTKV